MNFHPRPLRYPLNSKSTLQELCTYVYLDFLYYYQIIIITDWHENLANCEKNFTITDIDDWACEITYIPTRFKILGSTFRVEKPQVNSYQRDHVFIWLIIIFTQWGMASMTDFD